MNGVCLIMSAFRLQEMTIKSIAIIQNKTSATFPIIVF